MRMPPIREGDVLIMELEMNKITWQESITETSFILKFSPELVHMES